MKTSGLIVAGMLGVAWAAAANEVKMIGADEIRIYDRPGTYTFVPAASFEGARILVVGGGGCGGTTIAGGGGGGAVVTQTVDLVGGTTYTITVGAGGQRQYPEDGDSVGKTAHWVSGLNGGDSSLAGGELEIVAPGGGGGGGWSDNSTALAGEKPGRAGGNGGGGGQGGAGGGVITSEAWTTGHPGGNSSGTPAGGGGGAGGDGQASPSSSQSGNGGVGIECDITGEPLDYGAGGGGGFGNGAKNGVAGGPSAGDGAVQNAPGVPGLDGRGGGGGGGSYSPATAGGVGGCGTVVIRYCLGGDGSLMVDGSPSAVGVVNPAYGITGGHAVGDPISLTAEAEAQMDENTKMKCAGWKRYNLATGVQVEESDRDTWLTCAFPYPDYPVRVVWQWTMLYKVTATAGAGGTIAEGDAEKWAGTDAQTTVTALPGLDNAFHHWNGDVPEGHETENPLVIENPTGPMSLQAVFAASIMVAPEGGNDDGDGTSAQPLATLAKAVELAGEGSTIVLKTGRHAIADEILIDKDITIRGETGDWKDVVLEGNGTAQPYHRCFRITAAGALVRDLTISGFYATGGNNAPGGACAYLEGGSLENCRITGAFGSNYLRGYGVYNSNATVRDCVIDGVNCPSINSYVGLGYYQTGNNAVGQRLTITNNTASVSHTGANGMGAYITGGVFETSLVAWNTAPPFRYAFGNATDYGASGVRVESGTMRNCTVVSNHVEFTMPVHQFYAAVHVDKNGTVQDCVIADNTDAFGFPNDLTQVTGAKVTGCTFTVEPTVSRPLVAYVNPASANPVWPYDTPETAATNLFEALNPQVDGLVVHLAANSTNLVTSTVPIRKNVTIVGDGPRETTVVKGNRKFCLVYFYPSATEAMIANVTLRDGLCAGYDMHTDVSYTLNGGGLVRFDRAGTVSNCVLTAAQNGTGNRGYAGLGAYMDGGLLTHSLLHSFDLVSGDCPYGLVLRLRGGALVSHTVISNAVASSTGYLLHTGQTATLVWVEDGEIRNSLIIDNALTFNKGVASCGQHALAAWLKGENARLVNTTVVGNSMDKGIAGDSAGVRVEKGSVVNCLLTGNFVNSELESNATGGGKGTWYNNAAPEYATFVNGAGNIPVPEKLFRSGCYRLKGGSPLVNAGLKETWMDGATDFYGFPRVFGRIPDIGCAECQAGGLTIMVK